MGKFATGINLYKQIVSLTKNGKVSLLSTNPISKISTKGLRYMPEQMVGDKLTIGNSTLGEFVSYAKKIKVSDNELIPVFENPNSPLAKYYETLQRGNQEALERAQILQKTRGFKMNPKMRKIVSGDWDTSETAKLVDFTNYKNFLFDNAERFGFSKGDYQQIADEVAKLNKKHFLNNPEIRPEIRENLDKITHWNDVFHTQCQNWTNANQHIFYDEKEFMKAVEEYKSFVEQLTGKKVLIPVASRMTLATSGLGIFNNPNNYKDFDYILLSHGRGSSLIADLNHPDAWRFSDNQNIKVWDYIEKNVPKGKKVLVASCEHDGVTLAGKAAEEMVDRNGIKMTGIGNAVLASGVGSPDGPLKICESGIRHIIGHSNSNRFSNLSGIPLRTSQVNEYIPLGNEFKATYYDLDFTDFIVK